MKTNMLLQLVVALGLIALSVSAVQAGNGPGTVGFSAFFECQSINEATNLNQTVTIGDPTAFSQFPTEKATVGMGLLACKQVQVRDSAGNPFNPAGPPTGDVLKCYSLTVQGPLPAAESFTFSDFFLSGESVRVQGSRYLCGTANETQ